MHVRRDRDSIQIHYAKLINWFELKNVVNMIYSRWNEKKLENLGYWSSHCPQKAEDASDFNSEKEEKNDKWIVTVVWNNFIMRMVE